MRSALRVVAAPWLPRPSRSPSRRRPAACWPCVARGPIVAVTRRAVRRSIVGMTVADMDAPSTSTRGSPLPRRYPTTEALGPAVRAAARRVRRRARVVAAATRRRAPRADRVPGAARPADAGGHARQRPLVPARRDHRARHGPGLRALASARRRPRVDGAAAAARLEPGAGGIQAFYFRDPDGHFLEMLAFPAGKGDAKWHAPADRTVPRPRPHRDRRRRHRARARLLSRHAGPARRRRGRELRRRAGTPEQRLRRPAAHHHAARRAAAPASSCSNTARRGTAGRTRRPEGERHRALADHDARPWRARCCAASPAFPLVSPDVTALDVPQLSVRGSAARPRSRSARHPRRALNPRRTIAATHRASPPSKQTDTVAITRPLPHQEHSNMMNTDLAAACSPPLHRSARPRRLRRRAAGRASRGDADQQEVLGAKVNDGTVTHSVVNGKHVLALSADFKDPGTPDPHWQVVDSKGNVYLLQRIGIKGDKVNTQITLPRLRQGRRQGADLLRVGRSCARRDDLRQDGRHQLTRAAVRRDKVPAMRHLLTMRSVAPSMTALVLGLGLAASARAQVIVSPGSHPRRSQGGGRSGRRRGPPPERRRRHRHRRRGRRAASTSSALTDTFAASTTVAIEKARTAAQFRRPTRDFENAIAKGRTSLVAVNAMTPLQGGVPILVDGQIVGAIGVSGAMSAAAGRRHRDRRRRCAAGAAAASAVADRGAAAHRRRRRRRRRDLDGATTRAAFAKGRPLIETWRATRCTPAGATRPGMAEVHARDTDIFYVLDGTATLVTGGRRSIRRPPRPDEIRGARDRRRRRRARSPRATSSSSRTACRTGSRRSRARSSTTPSR